jgi:hypothetical protein
MKDLAPGWQVRCPKCGLTFDAGDLGIIRIGAVGKTNMLRICGQCRWLRWLSVEHKPQEIPDHAGLRCDLATHRQRAR